MTTKVVLQKIPNERLNTEVECLIQNRKGKIWTKKKGSKRSITSKTVNQNPLILMPERVKEKAIIQTTRNAIIKITEIRNHFPVIALIINALNSLSRRHKQARWT